MKINHAALYTNNLENLKQFYVTYFNGKANNLYENKNRGFKSYFISFEDDTRLELMSLAEVKEKTDTLNHLGFIHLAFSAGSKELVDQLTNKLAEDGYKVISAPRTTGDGYYESCVLDPDGNQIEIVIQEEAKLKQCCQEGYEIDGIPVVYDIKQAVKNSDVVLTDSIPSDNLTDFKEYQVSKALMDMANKNAILNPCPPFTRGEEVTADGIDSEHFGG